jgi:hypothetical protein
LKEILLSLAKLQLGPWTGIITDILLTYAYDMHILYMLFVIFKIIFLLCSANCLSLRLRLQLQLYRRSIWRMRMRMTDHKSGLFKDTTLRCLSINCEAAQNAFMTWTIGVYVAIQLMWMHLTQLFSISQHF